MAARFNVSVGIALWAIVLGGPVALRAEQPFAELVGKVPVAKVAEGQTLVLPYITWGGDVVTFHANGGLRTKSGSIFHKQGLNLELKAGDDFVQQVRDYLAGKTPFLRGTFSMIGMASEVIAQDPRTKGVVFLQLTWSAGDHMVARGHVRTAADLKGKTIALQTGGPHVGMLDDVLRSARLTWDDIKPVWAKDLTGKGGPAELFRANANIDACFVISPDMIGLTGGLEAKGSGAEGTVKDARVLVSTAQLSRSIADVYVCRKDWYDAHKDQIAKLTAGYLKACEEVVDLKSQYEAKGSEAYLALLKQAQEIYGAEVLPTLEEDAHGLIADALFVGYPGNVSFFREGGNLHGFEALQRASLDLAVGRGYAKARAALIPHDLDYDAATFTQYLSKTSRDRGERFRAEAVLKEIEELSAGALDDQTILSFTINFEPNQDSFSAEQYGVEYQRVIETADKFAGAVIAVRGHSDPTKTLLDVVKAGLAKGVLTRTGTAPNYQYALKGRLLDLSRTEELTKLIQEGEFDGVSEHNPRATMQAALNLSRQRSEAVRDSVLAFAKAKGVKLDASQIQPVGVGIREPFIAKPRNMDEAQKNMRVEFRLLRVKAEASQKSDFDF